MMKVGDVVFAAAGFLYRNPSEFVRTARDLVGSRLSIPLPALRWLAEHAIPRNLFPIGLTVDVEPPYLRLGAQLDAMGTGVRASVTVGIERLKIAADSVTLGVRLTNIELALAGESNSPLAVLIRSGALDLSRPGDLVAAIPMRPEIIVDAQGDLIVLDFLKLPVVSSNPSARIAAAVLSSVVRIDGIEADDQYLHVTFGSVDEPETTATHVGVAGEDPEVRSEHP